MITDKESLQIKSETHEVIELHPYEIWLIKRWRKRYRFGEITIVMQDGVPQRIKRVITNDDPRNDKNL